MPKARVLAVDDQRYFRELIEGLLVEESYEVCTVSSGEEALAQLERCDFDLVLTDLVMPGMDGTALVRAIKDRDADQEVIMVTGVVDVGTAVEAMKQGATDYVLKPFDRKALLQAVEKVLQRRRLRDEHARLMAENIEFMEVLSLYERAAGLFSTLAVAPLGERILESLCLETRAQGGVLWRIGGLGENDLVLSAAHGLVRVEEEPERIAPDRLGVDFRPLTEQGRSIIRTSAGPASREAAGSETREQALYVPLRHASKLIGLVRLSDKLEGSRFVDRDRASAERLAAHAGLALTNALRFQALERRSFRDPVTRAYTHAYFQDATRNEIQKGGRFGRNFSILRIEIALPDPTQLAGPGDADQILEAIARCIGSGLRSTDLLAAESERRYSALLPETDALGAALLKRRIGDALRNSEALCRVSPEVPEVRVAAVTFPSDGSQLEGLENLLDARLAQERDSLLCQLGLVERPFAEAITGLAKQARHEPPRSIEQIVRFLFRESRRTPCDRRLLFVSPGESLRELIRQGIEELGPDATSTEIVLVAEAADAPVVNSGFTRVSPSRVGTERSFLLLYGDGPAYAMVAGPREGAGTAFFHSDDRVLVEHLAFQLRRDLGIPVGH